jgi:hypothetical protein
VNGASLLCDRAKRFSLGGLRCARDALPKSLERLRLSRERQNRSQNRFALLPEML